AMVRDKLDAVVNRQPARMRMAVCGYSMGGCISRLLLSDSGDQLWMKMFGRPPDAVALSPHTHEYLHEELFFRHRPEIGREIFIAAPLRGSKLATGLIGSIAAIFIREPTL